MLIQITNKMASVKKKLVCIICLKRFDSENKENILVPRKNSSFDATTAPKNLQQEENESTCDSNGSTNTYVRFLRFVSQYFKLRNFTGRFIACAKEAKSEDGSPAKLETFCESCGELISEICGLYKQLRTAQLFLVWKLGQVGARMKKKGPVPGGPKSQRRIKVAAGGLPNVALMKQMNVDAARPVGAFRKALQLKCINATRKSMPDVVLHKGLFPEQWKFTYSATKQTLIRLITVFLLASSQIIKSNYTRTNNIINDGEQVKQLGNKRPCRKSRKIVKFSPTSMIAKNGLLDDGDNTAIKDDDDGDNMADKFGNDSDPDWSQGAASPMSVDSNASLTNKKIETCGKTMVNLRSRRNVVIRAEEDGDTDSSNSQDSDDEDNHKPKKRIRRQYIPESEKTIKCPHCPKLVVDRRGLARHLQMVHRSYIPCFCKKCGMRCRNQVEQVRHYREMHQDNRFDGAKVKRGRPRSALNPSNAKLAGLRRRRVPTQATHKPAGDGRRLRAILSPCPKCSQIFSKKNLKRHIIKVHKLGTARYECPYCYQTLVGEKRFKIHMECHENKTVNELSHWYCQVCGQHKYSKDSLNVHMKEIHKDKYVCTVCSEELETGKLLRDHLLINHETDGKQFHCQICRASFTTQQFYDIHRTLAHRDNRKFACDFKTCGYIFDTILEMNEHLKTHFIKMNQEENGDKDVEIFRCETCEMEFLKKYSLTLHQLLHTRGSSTGHGYDCPKCNKNINCKESLVIHYKFVHGDVDKVEKIKRFQCELCLKRFSKKVWFSTHVRLHDVPIFGENFSCEICDVRCVDSIALSVHRQGHNQDECPFKKDEKEDPKRVVMEGLLKMKKGITNQSRRRTELDRRFDPASPPPLEKKSTKAKKKAKDELEIKSENDKLAERLIDLSCKLENCGETFESAYLLRKHLEDEHEAGVPEGLKSIQCYFCPKRFCYQQSHEIHERAQHKTEVIGKFRCELESCRKLYHSLEDFHNHLKSHIGEPDTSFVGISFCGKCNWGFLTPESRDLHLLIHNSSRDSSGVAVENNRKQVNKPVHENSFICDEPDCGKIFKNRKRLSYHQKCTHSSKDWICDLCGFAFSMEYMLKKHMSTHEEPKFACDECGIMLMSKSCLDTHKNNKHNSNRIANSICSTCGKSFFTKTGLRIHFESTHKPESEWHLKCPRCPKRFYRKMFLSLHLKKCDGIGGEEVKTKTEKHIGGGTVSASTTNGLPRRSTRERKIKLRCRMNSHEKPKLACDVCGQTFTTKCWLNDHKDKKHNPNATPNSICSTCGKSFFTKGGLRNHIESTHKPESEWRLKCPSCPRRFYRRMLLNLHLKTCNGNGEEVKTERNIGGGSGSMTNLLLRRSIRERKKRRNWGDEDEEMMDKSATEDEMEEDKHEFKPSSLSTSSQQGHQNEFQDLLRLPLQQPLVSHHQLQYDPQKLWAGAMTTATPTGILPPGSQQALTPMPVPILQYPQMQFHNSPLINQDIVQQQLPQHEIMGNSAEAVYQSPTSSC